MSDNPNDRLRITFLTPNDDPNNRVVATVGIHIISMDMFLSKVKIVRKKDGTCYAASPSQKYKDPKTGEDKFANYWWFGEKSSTFFQQQVMKAITTYCSTKNIANPIL